MAICLFKKVFHNGGTMTKASLFDSFKESYLLYSLKNPEMCAIIKEVYTKFSSIQQPDRINKIM